jgi:DNA polymerase III alpha subunit
LAGLIPNLPSAQASRILDLGQPDPLDQTDPTTGESPILDPDSLESVLDSRDSLQIPPVPSKPWCSVGHVFDPQQTSCWLAWLNQFGELFQDRGYLISHLHLETNDQAKLQILAQLSRESRVELVAAGGELYHQPQRMILHDCLQAIATGTTIDQVARFRPTNAQRSLRTLEQIEQLYRQVPEAIANTATISSRIDFSLDSLRYEYPSEWSPEGTRPIDYLKKLTWEGAQGRYPKGVPLRVVEMLRHEMKLIDGVHRLILPGANG